jgi:hypothetical protein
VEIRRRRPKQDQWFVYRTDVSVGGMKRPRRWTQWLGVVLVGTTCAGLALGAFFWLVTLDVDGLLQAGRGLLEATVR